MEKRGLKEGQQFATLTDIISKAWAGKTTKEYKILKGLKKENLRDNMTNLELVLNMLAEASTTEISKEKKPKILMRIKTLQNRAALLPVIPEKQSKQERVRKW